MSDNVMKYIHWIVLGIILFVFVIFVAPKVVPEVVKAIAHLFGAVIKSANDFGGGIKEGLPKP